MVVFDVVDVVEVDDDAVVVSSSFFISKEYGVV